MPPTARERQLARARAARQAAKEAQARERRRRTLTVVGAVVAVLVVVGGGILAVRAGSGSDKKAAAPAASTSASASASTSAADNPCNYAATAGQTAAKPASLPPLQPATTGNYVATLGTNRGTVTFNLLAAKAPCAVGSFRSLATAGYFDNTPCHRLVVETGFGVLQCGDPSGTGSGGPGYSFKDENLTGATYPAGTVAMANSGANTNGSQFFLVYRDTQLPASYTPFGTITQGLDVLQKIAAGGENDANGTGDGAPKLPVQLQKVTVAAS